MNKQAKGIALILEFKHDDVHQPKPWPVAINERGVVTSGLGPDDGALLIGLGPAGQQRVTVFAENVIVDPTSVVGMTATFCKDGQFFLWNIPIASVRELT